MLNKKTNHRNTN